MRTNEEKATEVAELRRLKPLVPKRTMFGDDNHAAIDAQIEVIEEGLDEDGVYDRWPVEDNERLNSSARDAVAWLEGDDEMQPSGKEGWGGVAERNNQKK